MIRDLPMTIFARNYPAKGAKKRRRPFKPISLSGDLSGRASRLGSHDAALALGALAGQLACAAYGFCLFTSTFFGWLFIVVPQFHFAENAFALQFLLERAQRLVNIVVAYDYLHVCSVSLFGRQARLPLSTVSFGCGFFLQVPENPDFQVSIRARNRHKPYRARDGYHRQMAGQ